RVERTLVASPGLGEPPMLFADVIEDPTDASRIVYPLDGVVMPRHLYPVDVQWEGGDSPDVFRVSIQGAHLQATAYVSSPYRHWLIDSLLWASATRSDPGTPLSLRVDRWRAATGTAIKGAAVQMSFVDADLAGLFYYWEIEDGPSQQIGRIV